MQDSGSRTTETSTSEGRMKAAVAGKRMSYGKPMKRGGAIKKGKLKEVLRNFLKKRT